MRTPSSFFVPCNHVCSFLLNQADTDAKAAATRCANTQPSSGQLNKNSDSEGACWSGDFDLPFGIEGPAHLSVNIGRFQGLCLVPKLELTPSVHWKEAFLVEQAVALLDKNEAHLDDARRASESSAETFLVSGDYVTALVSAQRLVDLQADGAEQISAEIKTLVNLVSEAERASQIGDFNAVVAAWQGALGRDQLFVDGAYGKLRLHLRTKLSAAELDRDVAKYMAEGKTYAANHNFSAAINLFDKALFRRQDEVGGGAASTVDIIMESKRNAQASLGAAQANLWDAVTVLDDDDPSAALAALAVGGLAVLAE